jgi:hypothetical protein
LVVSLLQRYYCIGDRFRDITTSVIPYVVPVQSTEDLQFTAMNYNVHTPRRPVGMAELCAVC